MANNLNVKITADIGSLVSGLSDGKNAIDGFTNGLDSLGSKESSAAGAGAQLENGLHGVGESAQSATSGLENLGSFLQASVGHIAAYVVEWEGIREVFTKVKEAISEMVFGTAELSEKLENISESTGISTGGLEKLRFAAQLSGSDFDTLQRSISQLALKMLELNSGAANPALQTAMADLGLTPAQLSDSEHALDNIAAALQRVGISQKTIGDLSELLGGRGGARLIPILEKLDEANGKFAALNLAMGKDAVEAGAKEEEQMHTLGAEFEGLGHDIGSKLSVPLTVLSDRLTENIMVARQFISGDLTPMTDAMEAFAGSTAATNRLLAEHESRMAAIQGKGGAGGQFGAGAEEPYIPAMTTTTGGLHSQATAEPAESAAETLDKKMSEELEQFKNKEAQKVADAGNTAAARMTMEANVAAFIADQEKKLQAVPGAQDVYEKIDKEKVAAELAQINDSRIATKEAQADMLGLARSTASDEEAIAQAKFNLLKAQLGAQVQAGIITATEETKALQEAANQQYEIKRAALEKEIAIQEQARGGAGPKTVSPAAWTVADESAYQKSLTDLQTLALGNQAKLTEIATSGSAEQIKAAQSAATGEIAIAQAKYGLLQAQLQQQVQAGIITKGQETAALIDGENVMYAAKMKALDQEIATYPVGTTALQDALNKRADLEIQYQTKITQLQTAAAKDMSGDFSAAFSSIASGFDSVVDGMIKGTERISAAFRDMGVELLKSFAKSGIMGLFTGGAGKAAGGLGQSLFGSGIAGLISGALPGGGPVAGGAGGLGNLGLLGRGISGIGGLLGLGGGGPASAPVPVMIVGPGGTAAAPGAPTGSPLSATAGGGAAGQAGQAAGDIGALLSPLQQIGSNTLKAALSLPLMLVELIAHTFSLAGLLFQAVSPKPATSMGVVGGFPSSWLTISAASGALLGDSPAMAFLHPREMVLPADVTAKLLGGSSNSGSPQTSNITVHAPIYAMDGDSVRNVLHEHRASVADAVVSAHRDYHSGLHDVINARK